jgi:hypothetical protein
MVHIQTATMRGWLFPTAVMAVDSVNVEGMRAHQARPDYLG